MTIAVSETWARYQPLAQIGRGGMAEVILAEMQLGRGVTSLVVLKRLWPELADDPEFVSMFLREARLCARMNHPNVVRAYEIVEDAAGSAIAMEYLEGQPLARVLNRLMGSGTLALATRLRVLIDVLTALHYAHELCDYDGASHGIVHRDVNPQNVFVTYEGMVKLLDFGVAKSARDAYQTRPGELRGKLAYLAPEQALGEVVDRRADVFSVGVMLWEMLTGRRMWQSMTETSIMRHLTAGTIPSLPVDAAVPEGLAGACARALSRAPENRFATAGAFATELQRLLPAAEEAKARHLGRVVGLAFAPERAARRTLIEEHLRRARGGRRDAGVGRWTIPPQSADTELLPVLRPDRPTPGGMWAVNDQDLAQAIELSSEDLIPEPTHEPTPEPPPPEQAQPAPEPARQPAAADDPSGVSGSRMATFTARFRRTGWMSVGFAVAVVAGGIVYAAYAAGRRSVVALPVAVIAPPAVVPVPAPLEPAVEAATPNADAESVPADSTRRTRRRRTHAVPLSETIEEVPSGEAAARTIGRSDAARSPRNARAHSDDETLEPTIDLSTAGNAPTGAAGGAAVAPLPPPTVSPRRAAVRAIDVADPFQP